MPEPTRDAGQLHRLARDLMVTKTYRSPAVFAIDLIDAVLSEFLVVPRRYLDREELRDVPFGTLMEREDGQVWQRVDALLAVRVWPDEGADGGPSGPVFPARVIWQPPQSSVGSPEEEGQG